MLTRRLFTVGFYHALQEDHSQHWAVLAQDRPMYNKLLPKVAEVPDVRCYMWDSFGAGSSQEIIDYLQYGLVVGYTTFGTVLMEQLTAAWSIPTMMALASTDLDLEPGESPDSEFDAQRELLMFVLVFCGYQRSPSDPTMEAFRVLSTLDIPEQLRTELKYRISEEVANGGPVQLH